MSSPYANPLIVALANVPHFVNVVHDSLSRIRSNGILRREEQPINGAAAALYTGKRTGMRPIRQLSLIERLVGYSLLVCCGASYVLLQLGAVESSGPRELVSLLTLFSGSTIAFAGELLRLEGLEGLPVNWISKVRKSVWRTRGGRVVPSRVLIICIVATMGVGDVLLDEGLGADRLRTDG